MPNFRVKTQSSAKDGGSFLFNGTLVKHGQVISSDHDLDLLWPNRFDRVQASSSPVPRPVGGSNTAANAANATAVQERPLDGYGTNVSHEFDLPEGYMVYEVDDGFQVYRDDVPLEHKRLKSHASVQRFIASIV